MGDKKNIDRLFQEKLKDFEVTPSASVWENISEELHSSQKQRKGIPLWQKIVGVAASIALLIAIGNSFLNTNSDDSDNPENNVVNTDSNTTIQNNSNPDKTKVIEDTSNPINVVDNDSKEKSISDSDIKIKSNTTNSNTTLKKYHNSPSSVVSNNKSNLIKKGVSSKDFNNLLKDNNVNDVAENLTKSNSFQNKTESKENPKNAIDKKYIDSTINELPKSVENTTLANSNKEATEEVVSSKIKEEEKLLSLTEEVAANVDDDEDEKDKEKIDRWSVSPSFAPVYFNTLGSGSSIHSQFNNNSKTGDVNVSYGVSTSYAINNRLSVRAGINKVTLGYSTNDVVVYNNIQTVPDNPLLRNIAFNEQSQDVSFISVSEFNFAQVPGVISDRINASIDQKLGFLEIPLELQYRISNKKLGVNLIGGVSALFLSDNEIYSVQDGKSTLLGKATNVNSTSYSANFGLGLDYKVSQKINLNLEPVFKYQINTFNNTSGNFKPFFIGIYTGLKFKF
jgi:hypothetical protein